MIAIVVLSALFIIVGLLGGWLLYALAGLDEESCDGCGRTATRVQRHAWIDYKGRTFCSGDCFRWHGWQMQLDAAFQGGQSLEREAIIAWLRDFWNPTSPLLPLVADAIERGEHLRGDE